MPPLEFLPCRRIAVVFLDYRLRIERIAAVEPAEPTRDSGLGSEKPFPDSPDSPLHVALRWWALGGRGGRGGNLVWTAQHSTASVRSVVFLFVSLAFSFCLPFSPPAGG